MVHLFPLALVLFVDHGFIILSGFQRYIRLNYIRNIFRLKYIRPSVKTIISPVKPMPAAALAPVWRTTSCKPDQVYAALNDQEVIQLSKLLDKIRTGRQLLSAGLPPSYPNK